MSAYKMDYQIYQSTDSLLLQIEYLMLSGRASSRDEALTLIHSDLFLDFTMRNCIEIDLHSEREDRRRFLQKLKFFHVFSFHQMMNLETAFLKEIIDDGFSFSSYLFNN